MYPDKGKRPTDKDDILQDIIEAMSRTDARWKAAKPSDKKGNRIRYKSLANAYYFAQEKHEKQQQSEPKFKIPKHVSFSDTKKDSKSEQISIPKS